MRPTLSPRSRAAARLAALAGLALLAACSDDGTGSRPDPIDPTPTPRLAALQCEGDVAAGTLRCDPVGTRGGASASAAPAGGPSLVQHVLGGQGEYVRLASSGVSYAGGVFSFDVSVQNLSNLALATADGATRDDAGIRVFFHSGPTVTGGSGSITVANATGTSTFTAAGQPYFQYGGKIGGVDQGELGGDGVLTTSETSAAKAWQLNIPATVTTFSFVVYVATQSPPGAIATMAPQVTSVSPATLVPGATATITGANFNATPGSNVVTIGGASATVTGGNATQLTVTVPCTASGSVPVQVTQGGMKGAALNHPLQVTNQRTLGVGQAVVIAGAADAACNELMPSNATSHYVVAVYNTSTSPTSLTSFQLAADGDAPAPGVPAVSARARASRAPAAARTAPTLDAAMEAARAGRADDLHFRLLEVSRREHERLRQRFAGDARMRPSRSATVSADVPATTRTFRMFNIAGSSCSSYSNINATRVYYNGKVAIYEDDATPAAFKAASSATMQNYYNKLGDQFNADMEPIIRDNFGDPLRRDAVTDNNGVLVALFTPALNGTGVAGFVVSCDQYPNGVGNEASNFGEYFYAYQPSVNGTGYFSGSTPDEWFRTVRSTFIHETKHIASQAARVANGAASFEASWLEEGTARHSEELWARTSVYSVAWKGNTGYGSAGSPGSIYCDVRPTSAACNATNTRRPSQNMYRHFSTLYTFLQYPYILSPFGRTPYDDAAYFYATSWSLVRYAIDRHGASDAAFLTALTDATTTGVTNLAARAGVTAEQLQGGWALALYGDDYPGLAGGSADLQMPTWNFTDIFAGLNTDFPGSFTDAYPLIPTEVGFGSFGTVSVPEIYGGGVAYFTLSGAHTQGQILRLQASGGGSPSSSLRMAIARLE